MLMNRILRWYDKQTTLSKNIFSSFCTSIPFYFAAFLSSSVAKKHTTGETGQIIFHAITYLLLIFVVSLFYRVLSYRLESYKTKLNTEHETKFKAFTYLDRTIIKQHKIVKNVFSDWQHSFVKLVANVDRIQEIVYDLYQTFESTYGSQKHSGERIDFEVTFMTKSYIDGKITIPCSANRHGHKPRSMVLRKTTPNIYDDTETAKLYAAIRPDPSIISDTSVKNYKELYDNQTSRIKSSIVYPVVDEDNVLLGTLVVHCDHPNFFRPEDQKFWFDLFEIFAKKISVEKIKLDLLNKTFSDKKHILEINFEPPF